MSRRNSAGFAGLLLGGCSFGYELLSDDPSARVHPPPESLGGDSGDGDAGDGDSGDGDVGDGDMTTGGSGGDSGAGVGGDMAMGGAGGGSPYGEPTGTPREHCGSIPRLIAPPVIDGFVDDGVYLEAVEPVGWRNPDAALPPGNGALLGAAWRPDGVYFFVVVQDADLVPAPLPEEGQTDWNLWQGDSVEVYVDHDGVFDAPLGTYAEMGTRQIIVAAPASSSENNTKRAAIRRSDGSTDVYTEYDAANWIARPIPSGYVVEAFFDAATLNLATLDLVAGDTVGINFGHNVSGDGASEGHRLSQYFFQVRDPLEGDDNDYPFRNEATFCESLLTQQ